MAVSNDEQMIRTLQQSLYPGANSESVAMVISYCTQAKLDPLQKPVHIVPMWDSKSRTMRDVIMPGIGLYRTQASRSGEYGGISEPEFGDDITAQIGGQQITYPKWCKVTVTRLINGTPALFTAKELWSENYAVRGGKEKSIAPNAMWSKRPYAQIAKCAEAQALRKAFPELGAQPTYEEMEGKQFDGEPPVEIIDISTDLMAISKAQSMEELQNLWTVIFPEHQGKATVKNITEAKDQRKKQLIEQEVIEHD